MSRTHADVYGGVENVDGGRVEGVLWLCHHEGDDKMDRDVYS